MTVISSTFSILPDQLLSAPAHHLALNLLTGATAAQSCIQYPSASYYLYVPTKHPLAKRRDGEPSKNTVALPVVVVVHGSGRDAAAERDRWQTFGEAHDCVIVAPLFPIDLKSLDGVDNYKRIVYTPLGSVKSIFYDEILLQILEEVSSIWGSIDISTFNLVGFSGGGQFAHRFFYLHPDRLRSVSIGAPGNATRLDCSKPWPQGTQDVSVKFKEAEIQLEALRKVPVQLFIGSADTYHTMFYDGSRAALSRYGVLETLHDNFTSLDILHTFDVEPGVAHQGERLLHRVQPFVLQNLGI